MDDERTYTAFSGNRRVATGTLKSMLAATRAYLDQDPAAAVVIFDDHTGKQIDFDLRGTITEVLARLSAHPLFASDELPPPPRSGPGRPRLGVVGREVSLLPRHWTWLEEQPHGISAALRRLVDEARKRDSGRLGARLTRDAAAAFMTAMAGNLPGFEEASRALFADDHARLEALIRDWPTDIREHVSLLLRRGPRPDTRSPPAAAAGDGS
jgi:hypothetical protein